MACEHLNEQKIKSISELDLEEMRRFDREDIAVALYQRMLDDSGEYTSIDEYRAMARRSLMAAEAFLQESEEFEADVST